MSSFRRRLMMAAFAGGGGGIPSEYTQVEYIQCATEGPYIDTGVLSDNVNEMYLHVDISVSSTTSHNQYFGSNGNMQMQLSVVYGQVGSQRCDATVFHGPNNGPIIYINGSQAVSYGYHTFIGLPVLLFAMGTSSGANYFSKATLYGARVVINGADVRNFIPVRDSNNVGYLYDSVSGQIFSNLGSGSFTVGPDVI